MNLQGVVLWICTGLYHEQRENFPSLSPFNLLKRTSNENIVKEQFPNYVLELNDSTAWPHLRLLLRPQLQMGYLAVFTSLSVTKTWKKIQKIFAKPGRRIQNSPALFMHSKRRLVWACVSGEGPAVRLRPVWWAAAQELRLKDTLLTGNVRLENVNAHTIMNIIFTRALHAHIRLLSVHFGKIR